MPAGALRHFVTIAAPSGAKDDYGQVSQTFTSIRTGFARISVVTQREVTETNQVTAQVTHLVQMRWTPNPVAIAPGMRVLFGSRSFLIQTVENVEERNMVLNLYVLELNGVR